MKPAHAFWLTLVALAFIALQSFMSMPGIFVQIAEIVLGAVAVFASLSSAMMFRHRVLLFTTGLGLVLLHLVTWLQVATGRSLLIGDAWTYLLMLRSGVVGLGLIVFGFNATTKLWHRLIIAAVGFAWAGFTTLGAQSLTEPRQIMYLLLMVAVVGLSYWGKAYLNEGQRTDR